MDLLSLLRAFLCTRSGQFPFLLFLKLDFLLELTGSHSLQFLPLCFFCTWSTSFYAMLNRQRGSMSQGRCLVHWWNAHSDVCFSHWSAWILLLAWILNFSFPSMRPCEEVNYGGSSWVFHSQGRPGLSACLLVLVSVQVQLLCVSGGWIRSWGFSVFVFPLIFPSLSG